MWQCLVGDSCGSKLDCAVAKSITPLMLSKGSDLDHSKIAECFVPAGVNVPAEKKWPWLPELDTASCREHE